MIAVVTTGVGGFDKLSFQQVSVPVPRPGEVLVKVLAAGVNNTEINTRMGWYSQSVKASTNTLANETSQTDGGPEDGGWSEKTPFPFIQGTDCCGVVVDLAKSSRKDLAGRRVLVRPCTRVRGFDDYETVWMGSDFDGAFAQYVAVQDSEVFPVQSDWTDVELATIPCAYGTAENMIHRGRVGQGSRVLVTGASGGVGSAAVQLAVRRGAVVTAITSSKKADQVRSLGPAQVFLRDENPFEKIADKSFDCVIDNVVGADFSSLIRVLDRGGRYCTSGAVAGPIVELDVRRLYLKDITLVGCTAWDEPVFGNLISYIEKNEIRPLVAQTFPLAEIARAQEEFLKRQHFGNFVLVPPQK